MAAVVLGDIHLHFAWQAWHLWHWAGFGGALDFRCDAGRRDSFGVAGVALGDIYLHFAWQACHLWHWAGFGGARLVFGVRLGAATLLAWQAWHLATSIFTLRGRRGRRGTYGTGPALVARLVLGVTLGARESFGVAGLALGDIYLHFAWHPWYLVTSTFTLRGRRVTYGTGPALVARLVLGVTLGGRGRRSTWRHLSSLCATGVALMALGRLGWRAWFLV